MSPAEFIPLAEATGLILPLGAFALAAACRQIRRWGGRSPRVAVNLSARQFAQPDLVREIQAAMRQWDVPAQKLELEVTETAALRRGAGLPLRQAGAGRGLR